VHSTECLISIHNHSPFVKRFFQKLSCCRVNALFPLKLDDQTVGKAHDRRAAAAKATLHAVVVWAVRRRDGNTPVPDGDGVAAAGFPDDGKLLIDTQIYGSDNLSPAADLGINGVAAGQQKDGAQSKAHRRNGRKEQYPGFCFHRAVTSPGKICDSIGSIAKVNEKRKKKSQILLDFLCLQC
jgi:hypothetical protein